MQGLICVRIKGLNIARLIDRLVVAGVFVGDVKLSETSVKFCVYEKDLKTLKNICNIEKKTFEIIEQKGFKKLEVLFKRSVGFFLAIAVVFCYLFAFKDVVVEVEILCNEPYDISKIETLLNENGVVEGSLNNGVDIEKLILKNIDDLLGCSVKQSGGKLQITVYPAAMKEDVKNKSLSSKYDAVVTFAEAYSGELKIAVGDVVKKGDLLIDSNDVANGVVKGKVYFSATEIYNEKQTLVSKTGRFFRYNNLKIGNKYFYKTAKINTFSSFITEKCSFYLNENIFLPIICEEVYCFETTLKEEIVPFEKVEKEIMDKAYHFACEKIDDLQSVKNVTYSVVKDGSYTRVDCFVETEIMLF